MKTMASDPVVRVTMRMACLLSKESPTMITKTERADSGMYSVNEPSTKIPIKMRMPEKRLENTV